MKKFTNNALWGFISMGLNLVIVVLVIVSAVQLSTYDKKNTYLQDSIMPTYSFWKDSVDYSKTVLEKKEKGLEGYTSSLNEVKASAEVVGAALAENPDDKDLQSKYYSDTVNMKTCIENIERIKAEKKLYQDTLSFAEAGFKPWAEKHDEAVKDAEPSLKNFNMMVIIAAILLVLKVLCFGIWMMRNSKNIRKICPWWTDADMSNGDLEGPQSPIRIFLWSIYRFFKRSDAINVVSWFIPIYNLFKPCSLFSDMISETKYMLRDKSIITDTKDNNHMESISLWWGSMLFARIVVPLFIGGLAICLIDWYFPIFGFGALNDLGGLAFGTYFGNTGLFFYLRPHVIVLALYIIGWLVYLGYECYMIFSYNKLNKMLCDNEDKFDFEEPVAKK